MLIFHWLAFASGFKISALHYRGCRANALILIHISLDK